MSSLAQTAPGPMSTLQPLASTALYIDALPVHLLRQVSENHISLGQRKSQSSMAIMPERLQATAKKHVRLCNVPDLAPASIACVFLPTVKTTLR